MVPGLKLKRKSLRTPYAHTLERIAFAFPFQKGLSDSPWPFAGLTRRILPLTRLMSCARSARASTVQ